MDSRSNVTFGEMTDNAARALVARNHVGRIAYSLHDRVDIEPISYACVGEWIYMRTSSGSKTQKLLHHPWVAFQVDEIRAHTDWESVLVHGRIQHISDDGSMPERKAYSDALDALRMIDPNALGASDTVPHRDQVLRLHIDEIDGQRAERAE